MLASKTTAVQTRQGASWVAFDAWYVIIMHICQHVIKVNALLAVNACTDC